MDGCLACKSCVGQCPIKVDVPAFRSRFLELYYGRYLRPPKDRLVASLERVLPWLGASADAEQCDHVELAWAAASLPRSDFPRCPCSTRSMSGASSQPAVCAKHRLKRSRAFPTPSEQEASSSSRTRSRRTTTHPVVLDFFELIRRLGFTPWLAPFKPNGKPQHVLGFLGAFERTARANAELLNALAATGMPLVGIDPSMTLTYRAEYAKALGETTLPASHCRRSGWRAASMRLPQIPVDDANRWALLPHCTERTNAPGSISDWQRVCQRLGVHLQVLASGCCGMAGLYGHETANRGRSEAIYRLSWAHHLADPRHAGRVTATGYSCRSQVGIVDGMQLLHPLQLLLRRVKANDKTRVAHLRHHESVADAHHEEL